MNPDNAIPLRGKQSQRLTPATDQTEESVDIRPLWAGFPTGVSIVTAMDGDGRPWGMTCTSLCSVSLDPPILLICLRCGSPTLKAVQDRGLFAINLLHDEAQASAELFSSGVVDRFDHIQWRVDERAAGPHLPNSAHTIADCAVVEDSTVGDHVVIMGRIRRITRVGAHKPLLYGLRRYATWRETVAGNPISYEYDFIS
ncbi:flavin reductase [Streptosporangium sp. LJ11]|uniref:flavin reductase family protein n=1 Tax=Streptosporangium sp. LJ11 TaxID=3436927 RepID=UPI003F7A58A5